MIWYLSLRILIGHTLLLQTRTAGCWLTINNNDQYWWLEWRLSHKHDIFAIWKIVNRFFLFLCHRRREKNNNKINNRSKNDQLLAVSLIATASLFKTNVELFFLVIRLVKDSSDPRHAKWFIISVKSLTKPSVSSPCYQVGLEVALSLQKVEILIPNALIYNKLE